MEMKQLEGPAVRDRRVRQEQWLGLGSARVEVPVEQIALPVSGLCDQFNYSSSFHFCDFYPHIVLFIYPIKPWQF